MKFVIESITKNSGRIGSLTQVDKLPGKSIETPLLLLHTKGCSVPHITKEVFDLSFPTANRIIEVNLVSTNHFQDAVKASNLGGICEFAGMKDFVSFLTLKDPSSLCPSGYHEKDLVPIFTKSGKVTISADKYMDAVEVLNPDFYTTFCDSDTSLDCPKKRVTKSVERSKKFFETCITRHQNLPVNSKLIASLVGGSNLKERENFIKELKEHEQDIFGYFVDGCHNNGESSYNVDQNSLKEIVQHSLNLLPSEKLKIMLGCYSPLTTVELIQSGIDLFDTSIAHLMTRNNKAFVFRWDENGENSNVPYLDLTQEIYKDDFSPFMENCECLACKKSTRAYVNHLLLVHELLGPIYLMIHNIHHYLEFFKEIRNCIKNDDIPKLIEKLSKYRWEDLKLIDKPDMEEKTDCKS